MKYTSTITSRPSSAELLDYYTDISLNLPRSPKQKKQFLVSLHCVIFNFLNSQVSTFLRNMYQKKSSQQRSHILISLDFTARFQMVLKLPKKKNVCYSITDDNIVQSEFFPSKRCCENLSNVISLGQEVCRTSLKYS